MCEPNCKQALLLSWQQSCTSPTTHAGVQAISISSSSSFFSSVGCADDEALPRLFQTSFLFAFLVALPVLVVLDIFLLQVLPDIVRPDSSCKSFLVSCQAVTNPLLVG